MSVDKRPRAISTDESNRKANMEARNRAIAAAGGANGKARATSPAPSPRGHRRDRSSDAPSTRFPIQTSPTATTDSRNSRGSLGASVRQSLEVPGTTSPPPLMEEPLQMVTNGADNASEASEESTDKIAKSDSLSRASVGSRFSVQRRAAALNRGNRESMDSLRKRDSIDSVREDKPVGVSLVDKPMDD